MNIQILIGTIFIAVIVVGCRNVDSTDIRTQDIIFHADVYVPAKSFGDLPPTESSPDGYKSEIEVVLYQYKTSQYGPPIYPTIKIMDEDRLYARVNGKEETLDVNPDSFMTTNYSYSAKLGYAITPADTVEIVLYRAGEGEYSSFVSVPTPILIESPNQNQIINLEKERLAVKWSGNTEFGAELSIVGNCVQTTPINVTAIHETILDAVSVGKQGGCDAYVVIENKTTGIISSEFKRGEIAGYAKRWTLFRVE